MDKVQVVYSQQDWLPATLPSLFLAGPTPRKSYVKSWRPTALRLIRKCRQDLVLYYPEPQGGGQWDPEDVRYTRWERAALARSRVILFWMDRKLETMPGFRANTEWGYWLAQDPTRLVLAHPPRATGTRGMDDDAAYHGVPVVHTLNAGIELALAKALSPQ